MRWQGAPCSKKVPCYERVVSSNYKLTSKVLVEKKLNPNATDCRKADKEMLCVSIDHIVTTVCGSRDRKRDLSPGTNSRSQAPALVTFSRPDTLFKLSGISGPY